MKLHPEIENTQRRVLALGEEQLAALRHVPSADALRDLMHQAEEVKRTAPTFTAQTAAEINRAVCQVILEERAAAGNKEAT